MTNVKVTGTMILKYAGRSSLLGENPKKSNHFILYQLLLFEKNFYGKSFDKISED